MKFVITTVALLAFLPLAQAKKLVTCTSSDQNFVLVFDEHITPSKGETPFDQAIQVDSLSIGRQRFYFPDAPGISTYDSFEARIQRDLDVVGTGGPETHFIAYVKGIKKNSTWTVAFKVKPQDKATKVICK